MDFFFTDNLILFLLTIFLQFYIVQINKRKYLYRPIFIFPSLLIIFFLFGNINLLFFQNIVGWFSDIQPFTANNIVLLSIILLQIIIIFFTFLSKKKYNHQTYFISLAKWNFLTYSLFAVSLIFNFINYRNIGGIVLFKNNLSGYERFDIYRNLAFPKFISLSSFLIVPLFINLFFIKKNKLINLTFLLISIFFAGGLGNRQPIIQPLLISFFFICFTKKIKIKSLLFGLVCIILFLIGITILRGDSSNIALTSYQSFLGIEYRDFLRLYQDKFTFLNGSSIFSIVLNPIPKQIFDFLDLNKDDFRIYSAYVVQELWGNTTGQRVGLWGEFFINFGNVGLIAGFAFWGYIVSRLDWYLTSYSLLNPRVIFLASYFYVLIIFSIFGSFATIGDDLGNFGIYIFLYYLTVFQKRQKLQFKLSIP